MEVAVVVITHNYAQYVLAAIDSAARQPDVSEIVVVDDASTDNVEELVSGYKDIRYFRIDAHNQHEGRRTGFRETEAPFVCFLDADDILGDGYIAEGLNVLKNEAVSVAFSDTYEFTDERPQEFRHHPHRKGRIERQNYIHAGALAKRSAIARSRVLDFELPDANKRYSDWWLWRHVLRCGEAQWSPGRYLYRRHPGSVSCKMDTPHGYRYCHDLVPCWDRP